MNLSDAEIIKALECCTKGNTFDVCSDCPLLHTNICTEETGVMKLALDLINRLKAENKNCGVKIQNQREQLKACNEKIKEQQAEIERLEASIKEVNEYLSRGGFAKGIALVYRLVKEMGE